MKRAAKKLVCRIAKQNFAELYCHRNCFPGDRRKYMTYSKEELRHAMLLYAVTDRAWTGGRRLCMNRWRTP